MVGLRWGTEERAADQGGGGSTFLLYLRLLLIPPTYIHKPTLAYLHTFFFDFLPTYFPTLYFQGPPMGPPWSIHQSVDWGFISKLVSLI